MNIGRGLFRLWILLAGLWAIVVTSFSYDSLFNTNVPARGFYFPKDVSKAVEQAEIDVNAASSEWGTYEIISHDGYIYVMKGKDPSDASNRLLNALPSSPYVSRPVLVEPNTDHYRSLEFDVIFGSIQKVITNEQHQFALYAATGIDQKELARQVNEVKAMTETVIADIRSQRRLDAIPGIIVFLVIPPLCLLGFGWIAGWVVAGFRTRQA